MLIVMIIINNGVFVVIPSKFMFIFFNLLIRFNSVSHFKKKFL